MFFFLFFFFVGAALPCSSGQKWQTRFTSVVGQEKDNEYLKLASQFGTDKVNYHNYDYLYSKYLAPVRYERLRLLEIGLGCNMRYGPGHSFKVIATLGCREHVKIKQGWGWA